MSEKYKGLVGRAHLAKESAKEAWSTAKEGGAGQALKAKVDVVKEDVIRKINHGEGDYDHLYRRKSRWELTRISAAVMGIEFAYAAETAFVSPTLLKIGVEHQHMTLIWCLSPLIGFFLTPIFGSLSDRCHSNLGRRRPFIILLSIGVVLGLILVPNGKLIGKQLGDQYPREDSLRNKNKYIDDEDAPGGRLGGLKYDNYTTDPLSHTPRLSDVPKLMPSPPYPGSSNPAGVDPGGGGSEDHSWGIFFTVLGTVLLDFDADACQSPSRAYLLDVTLPEDHAIGLSTFTVMAGLGGSLGYVMGAMNWGVLAKLFGGHVRLVFTLVLGIFIACVFSTLTSFAEIPLDVIAASQAFGKGRRKSSHYSKFQEEQSGDKMELKPTREYGSMDQGGENQALQQQQQQQEQHVPGNPFAKKPTQPNGNPEDEAKYLQVAETSFSQASPMPVEEGEIGAEASIASLTHYLWTIIYMPNSMRILCLTNLFCWSSLVCYSLYFTDFVGEAVFDGDPRAGPGSEKRKLYDQGVQFGCWGMALYSLSCSIYSFWIETLVKKFRARPVYVGGQLIYSAGMVLMAVTRSWWGVLLFSWSAGVMYSTLFTMPYLIIAHYHETNTYSEEDRNKPENEREIRGIGTDVGIVSSMVFLAQFILSLTMGAIINAVNSTIAVVVAASVLSFCGAITACFVTYLDL